MSFDRVLGNRTGSRHRNVGHGHRHLWRACLGFSILFFFPLGAAAATDDIGSHPVGQSINGQTDANVPYGTHVYGSTWTVVDEWGYGRLTDPNQPDYDESVVDDGTGNIVWRVSNAVANSGYSDQPNTVSSPLPAGETGAGLWNDRGPDHTVPTGPAIRANASSRYFSAGMDFKSATGAPQPGLAVRLSAVPRQSAYRVTWLEIADTGSGFDLTYSDVDSTGQNWVDTVVASGLSYTDWHSIDMFHEFVDGVNPDGSGNDVVKIVIDGQLVHTGTTWETYYRTIGPKVYAVDAIMFRMSTAAAGTAGNGLFFDNVAVDNLPFPDCGEGVVTAPRVPGGFGEQCDDGNTADGDCCSSTCTFESSGAPCGSATDDTCTHPDKCDGAGTCDPDDEPATTVCRASAGTCDVVENCDGAGSCPADAFKLSGTECRASGGDCDVTENCTGDAALCPSDAFKSSSTECRASAGDCDVAENCTGDAALCPSDALEPSSTECRAPVGPCDAAENCTGGGALCPADALEPSGTVCRATAGDCDVAETCTGASVLCPADGFQPSETLCTDDGDPCTRDRCGGGGTCAHPPIVMAEVCNWVVVGGTDTRAGKARTRSATEVTGSICADIADIGESSLTPGDSSWAATSSSGTAVRVEPAALIAAGDVATGGGCVRGLNGGVIFDTSYRQICCSDGSVALSGGGEIDACGTSPLIDACLTAKGQVPDDVTTLNSLPATDSLGLLDCSPATPCTIEADGSVSVVDIDRIIVRDESVLTIDALGDPNAVFILRVARGIRGGLRATFELTGGAQTKNVLFYVAHRSCRLGKDTQGAGTLFCPGGKTRLPANSVWDGSLAGGKGVDIGESSIVTHVPFLGLAD